MSGTRFDADTIRTLAQILRDTDLTEIELVEGESRIRVARAAPSMPAHPAMHAVPVLAPAAAAPAAVAAPAAARAEPEHPGLVTSPMVGVAYLAADPGAAAFVSLGDRVAQGQTLLLIEAMKTYNQIRSPRDGTVTRILVETGTPVEYGEPLMLVE